MAGERTTSAPWRVTSTPSTPSGEAGARAGAGGTVVLHGTPRTRAVGGLLVAALTFTTAGCTPDRPEPDAAAESLADGLEALDLSGVAFAGTTPAEATEQLTAAVEGLEPWRPQVEVVDVRTDEDDDTRATAQLDVTWDVDAGDTDWTYTVQAPLTYGTAGDLAGDGTGADDAADDGAADDDDAAAADPAWRVEWSPELIAPGMVAGETLAVERVPAARAGVLGEGGAPIVVDRPVLRLGVDKVRVTDAAGQEAAARALAALTGLDADEYAARVAAAGERAFVEAIVVRAEDPGTVDVDAARAVPGVTVVPDVLPLAPTRAFARPLLGTVGQATAEIVEESDGAVVAGDLTGLSGLQRQYDELLRGRPGLTIRTTGSAGGGTRDLFRREPVPGDPLRTTLSLDLQTLAETTLAGVAPPSAIVALRASTGEVLAAASGPGSEGLSTATLGRYAPGSTFKVATALALLRAGLTPESTVACPPTITVEGRAFENYPGYPAAALGDVPLRTAFAHSCNTAMIGARDVVPQAALAQAAGSLGLGQPDGVGFPAFLGSVPAEARGTEHAASLIGQGRVEASPLAMAVVAASVASGRTVRPVLVLDDAAAAGEGGAAPGDDAAAPAREGDAAVPLTSAEGAALQGLMRAVVTEGSAELLADVPGPPVGAKSGTAQFGTEDPPRNHAWMIGVQDDLAVAVFVEEGESGTQTAGPLLESFLRGTAS